MNSDTYQQIELQVSNAQAGQNINVGIAYNGAQVAFSTGLPFSNQSGAQVVSSFNALPIQIFSVNSHEIRVLTSQSGSGGGSLTFQINLWLTGEQGISSFYLRSASDPGVEVTAAIGNSVPQVVNQTQTLFSWSS